MDSRPFGKKEGRLRQAALILLGPDEEWRKWCARALAVNRVHKLICPPRPDLDLGKPKALVAPKKPAGLADPWPFPVLIIPEEKAVERVQAILVAAFVVHQDDTDDRLRPLLDRIAGLIGHHRVSLTVIADRKESRWTTDEGLKAYDVGASLLLRHEDTLTLLQRARPNPDARRLRASIAAARATGEREAIALPELLGDDE